MIKKVMLGEEIVIRTNNKVGLLADISALLAEKGINIEAASGYSVGQMAELMIITSANLVIVGELKKKRYRSVREIEVVIAELENRPGALKMVTGELKRNKIDIKHLYVTSPSTGASSRMILNTSDNEAAIALLSKQTAAT